jgi:hypothetical protein
MLDDSAHLAAHGGALAGAQIFHLLDQVRKIEVDVRAGRGETAQCCRRALGTDVRVLLVE